MLSENGVEFSTILLRIKTLNTEGIIVGCGYLGRRVAGRLAARGSRFRGVVRSAASARVLAAQGMEHQLLDLDHLPLPEIQLQGVDLFYFAPPPRAGHRDQRVRNLVEAFATRGRPRRVVYLSTTGVYGDCRGAWVNERQSVNPVVDRARRRWDAEQCFRAWRDGTGGELVILRVAGIYGPGRLPLDRLRKGLPMVREQEAPFSNRIHIDDLVEVCVAAMERGRDGETYNVSDGHPSTMTDYFNRIADLARLPRPAQITLAEGDAQLSAGMMSYMRESRRLDNGKMLRELGVSLRYPGLESGLPACFE